MQKNIILLLFLISLSFSYADELELWSEAAISVDFTTNQILYKKNIDKNIPPASMAKLVNLFMVYEAISENKVQYSDIIPVSFNADYKNLPRDSSLMFIEEGQTVTLYELMLGLAIPSGNDAAIAIAEYLYGNVNNYINEVNLKMKNLGFNKLQFTDASGYDDNNNITVLEFSEFLTIFIKKYPESIKDLFMIDEFTYPKYKNGPTSIGGIKQYNHNSLLGIYPGVDGLKTGFINKSGMNISLTAQKNGRRVIIVLAGAKDSNKQKAELKRFYDAVTLLNYSFDNFTNVYLDKVELPEVKVNFGKFEYAKLYIPYKRLFTLNRDYKIEYSFNGLISPLEKNYFIGYANLTQGDFIYKFPVYTFNNIK